VPKKAEKYKEVKILDTCISLHSNPKPNRTFTQVSTPKHLSAICVKKETGSH
jgi:hypothetical protein